MGYKGDDKQDAGMFYSPFIPLEDNKMTEQKFIPNARNHLIASLIKSLLRLAGYAFIGQMPVPWALPTAIVLILSEVVGIIEELV